MELTLILELPPSVNALYTNQAYYNRNTGRYTPTGRRILSKEGRSTKRTLRKQAIEQLQEGAWNKEEIGDNFIYMDIIIYFNRKGRDSDNINKALQDSLEGIVYENDSQVLPRTQKVLIDRERPRVVVKFKLVEFRGIFDNEKEALSFENHCKSCNRYRKGRCSILQDSLQGVIREEVNGKNCNSYKKKKD